MTVNVTQNNVLIGQIPPDYTPEPFPGSAGSGNVPAIPPQV